MLDQRRPPSEAAFRGDENGGAGCAVLDQRRPPPEAAFRGDEDGGGGCALPCGQRRPPHEADHLQVPPGDTCRAAAYVGYSAAGGIVERGGAPGSAEVGRSSKLARWTIAPDGKGVPFALTADGLRTPIEGAAVGQRIPIGRTSLADAGRVGFDVLRRAAMANLAVVKALRLQMLAGALAEFELRWT